jgi:hypothetical protein
MFGANKKTANGYPHVGAITPPNERSASGTKSSSIPSPYWTMP